MGAQISTTVRRPRLLGGAVRADGVAWLALATVGWVAGHEIAYAVAELLPHTHGSTFAHVDTGGFSHGYLAPLVRGAVAAVALWCVAVFGLAWRCGTAPGGPAAGGRAEAAIRVAVPPSAFVVVEGVEHWTAGAAPSWRMLAAGVVVQVLFATIAWLAADLLIDVARAVADRRRRTLPAVARACARQAPPTRRAARVRPPLADRAAGRAPPLLVAS